MSDIQTMNIIDKKFVKASACSTQIVLCRLNDEILYSPFKKMFEPFIRPPTSCWTKKVVEWLKSLLHPSDIFHSSLCYYIRFVHENCQCKQANFQCCSCCVIFCLKLSWLSWKLLLKRVSMFWAFQHDATENVFKSRGYFLTRQVKKDGRRKMEENEFSSWNKSIAIN